MQQEKDKHGKRFLTCYLLPQEQIVKPKNNMKYLSLNNDYCFRDRRYDMNKVNSNNQIESNHHQQHNHLNYDRNYLNIVDKTNLLALNHHHHNFSGHTNNHSNSNHQMDKMIDNNQFILDDSRLIRFKNELYHN